MREVLAIERLSSEMGKKLQKTPLETLDCYCHDGENHRPPWYNNITRELSRPFYI